MTRLIPFRPRKGPFLLLLAAIMVQSCAPAGYVSYLFFNQSDGQLSFADCNKNTTIIPQDDYAEVLGLIAISSDNFDCFRKRDLVLVRDNGSTWRYQIWDHRAVRSTLSRKVRKARERELADFVAPPAHPTAQVYLGRTTIVPLVVGKDGAIRPVRWEAYDNIAGPDTQLLDVYWSDGVLSYTDRKDRTAVLMKARPVLSGTDLPSGFPIKPLAGAPSQ